MEHGDPCILPILKRMVRSEEACYADVGHGVLPQPTNGPFLAAMIPPTRNALFPVAVGVLALFTILVALIPIGRAQVLRVTPFGATVMITGQEQPKVEEGTSARIAAKMP